MIRHIYVHIPFCARICPYCAFYKDRLDRSQTARFCEAMLRELEASAKTHLLAPTTIYFGGGTPTALSTPQLETLLAGFQDQLNLGELVEWTCEANPGSVSPQKARLLRRLGVNRVSLGVQSWDDQLLKLLGREHNARQAEESFKVLRRAGFKNINIDLMFALPGQTSDQWRLTLEKTISLQPEHISTYCLTYEEDTEFFQRHARGELHSDSNAEADLFEMTMSTLESAGYEHCEISNYARPGFASIHNQAYWAGDDYLGIGPSAVSTVRSERWQNICSYREYSDRLFACEPVIGSREHLTSATRRSERIALLLRTRNGVPVKILDSSPDEVGEFVRLGLLQKSNGNFSLTHAGKLVADSVAEAFV